MQLLPDPARRFIRRVMRLPKVRRQLPTTGAPFRVHVGAGPVRLAGWLNTDIDRSAEYFLDATRPWPLPDGSISHVYADNFVEHLTLVELREFLTCARRALASGGRVRLATPDVGAIARLYVDGGPAADSMVSYLRERGYVMAHQVDILRVTFSESGHERGYLHDEVSLAHELVAAGFSHVRRYPASQSDDPVLRGLETRTDAIAIPVQMSLEAVR